MGTICILLGLIIFIIFIVAGFIASNAILGNITFMSLLAMNSNFQVYLVVVGACAFIGLLICLSLVMSGLIYNRVCKNGAALKKINRH